MHMMMEGCMHAQMPHPYLHHRGSLMSLQLLHNDMHCMPQNSTIHKHDYECIRNCTIVQPQRHCLSVTPCLATHTNISTHCKQYPPDTLVHYKRQHIHHHFCRRLLCSISVQPLALEYHVLLLCFITRASYKQARDA